MIPALVDSASVAVERNVGTFVSGIEPSGSADATWANIVSPVGGVACLVAFASRCCHFTVATTATSAAAQKATFIAVGVNHPKSPASKPAPATIFERDFFAAVWASPTGAAITA